MTTPNPPAAQAGDGVASQVSADVPGGDSPRSTPPTLRAIRVEYDNLAEVASICGGHTWAAGVVVPTRAGEVHAPVGALVVQTATGWQVA